MTDYEALVLACLHDPDDEGPRLILADFLDEQGTPHLLRYSGCWCLCFQGPSGDRRQCLTWRLAGDMEYVYHQSTLGLVPEEIGCQGRSDTPCWKVATVRHEGRWLCGECARAAEVDELAGRILWGRRTHEHDTLTVQEVLEFERRHPLR